MENKDSGNGHSNNPKETFVEGEDYYFEGGMMVLTSKFLTDRRYCCGNDCRHCPYLGDEKKTLE